MSRLVSVVSLSYNRIDNVRELLTVLRRQTYSAVEVILVDNASPDGTAGMVRRDFPEVRLIETDGNLGMGAYNLGFQAAQGDYILVMDDDGLPGSDHWIEQVVARFEANPRLGAVSCTIRMCDTGKIAHDSPQFVPEGSNEDGYLGVAFNGTGAGLRTAALREVGYYPLHYYITYLELHLCTRLLDAGWQVLHFPAIEAWHNRPSGSSIRPLDYHGTRNYLWYVWELYPWPHVFTETIHQVGSRLKLMLEGRLPLGRFWRSTRDGFLGARQAIARRRPITLQTLNYTRRVRRHGNWHDLTPEIRSFDLEVPERTS